MKAYQLKISLTHSHPPIWRRCIIPHGLTFSQLAVVLNIIMGWEGRHLTDFLFKKQFLNFHEDVERENSSPWGFHALSAENSYIDEYIEKEPWFTYTYDFGDNWTHRVTVEKILPEYDKNYPTVVKYKCNCPPEDCGGIYGYDQLLKHQSDNMEEEMYFTIETYDMAQVNEYLAKHCVVIPHKIEHRNERKIYSDFAHDHYGLFTKYSEEKARKAHKNDIWNDQNFDSLLEKIKKELDDPANFPIEEFTLKECLQFYDKESLKNIASDKKIPYKSKDTKGVLVQKINTALSPAKVIESYFLCVDDEEMNNFKKALKSPEITRKMTVDDFPQLSDAIYANYSEGYGIDIPKEVKNAFKTFSKNDFTNKRHRYLWLLKCLEISATLYGITPIDILVKLFNRHKKFKTNARELRAVLQDIPADILNGELRDDTFYAPLYESDSLDLLQKQGDKPFYIPTVREIETCQDELLTPNPYEQNLIAFFNSTYEMDNNMLYKLLLIIQVCAIDDGSPEEILDILKTQGLIFQNKSERALLLNFLSKYVAHTRKTSNRGFKDVELNQQNSTDVKSNLIQVDNWRKK